MKILIIALGRTGSTSLLFKLAEENGLSVIMEPLKRNEYREDENDIIIKTLIWQIPDGENPENWFKYLISKFDKTILLTRRDLRGLTESLAYYRYHKHNGFHSNTPYLWEKTPNYDEIESLVIQSNDILNKIGKELNIEITYYEDIFKSSMNERLRLGDINKRTLI